uniref:Thioredoxin domain-containing protein n=1 Tax=Globodera rostochiensis TaxID=31243 RepID=A0A914H752_GLORO
MNELNTNQYTTMYHDRSDQQNAFFPEALGRDSCDIVRRRQNWVHAYAFSGLITSGLSQKHRFFFVFAFLASALRRRAVVRSSRCCPSLALMLLLLPTLFLLSASAYPQQQQDTLLYKRSERQCSAENFCKEEDFFHYYGCNFGICDFHLQPWLYVLIAFIVLCFLLSVLISLINCSESKNPKLQSSDLSVTQQVILNVDQAEMQAVRQKTKRKREGASRTLSKLRPTPNAASPRPSPLLVLPLLLLLLLFLSVRLTEARKSSHHYKVTAAEDPVGHPQEKPTPPKQTSTSKSLAPAATKGQRTVQPQRGVHHNQQQHNKQLDSEFSIEDVDEEQIDQILRDTSKNLVVFFYDGRAKCPECGTALSEVEEIDDDVEATGYIEVVKTDDRRVARECGVSSFPALVYFRRNKPILYDGDFSDSTTVLRWLRAHDEVATWDLTDDNFEWRTDSHSPDEGALDWLVMFYDSEELDCNAFVAVLETVAHKLRGLVHAGKVDTSVSDDVTERFRIDESQCPTFLLFHRGKFFRYNDPAKDARGLTAFALHKYKEQRGHRVPEPPTVLEHFYEHVKERMGDAIEDNQTLTVICVGGAIVIVGIFLLIKAYRIRKEQQAAADGKKGS